MQNWIVYQCSWSLWEIWKRGREAALISLNRGVLDGLGLRVQAFVEPAKLMSGNSLSLFDG